MGKFHISTRYLVGLLCAAFTLVPAVASAGTLSVDVSPTTGYSVTNRSTVALPPRTTTGPVQAYNPTFGPLAGGGAYQTTSSGITITAIKNGGSASTTMSGRMRATAGAMRNGLTRCLTSFRCNMALMAGGAGIEALFSGIDWLIEEGSPPIIRQKGGIDPNATYPPPESTYGLVAAGARAESGFVGGVCSGTFNDNGELVVQRNQTGSWVTCHSCGLNWREPLIFAGYTHATCWYGSASDFPPPNPDFANKPPSPPLTPSEIQSGVNSHYNPDPTDLPYISTGGLDFSGDGVDFEVTDIPSITGADSPTFIENSDGTSTGTYSEYKFSWGGPSKQPNVDVEEKTTEKTYGPSGEVTSTTTTIVNGSGSSANVPPEIPTDCAFMPTVCRFIDWFTEPDPETSQPVDFTQLIDNVDIDKDFTVGASTAACPAPFVVNLSWVPSVQVSLQPFCDLADLLRPVLLAIASLFSGMIILRT